MALSKDRVGEISMMCIEQIMEEKGLTLHPKETKREVKNMAKKLGVPPKEMAEFTKIVGEKMYAAVIKELDEMIADPQTDSSN